MINNHECTKSSSNNAGKEGDPAGIRLLAWQQSRCAFCLKNTLCPALPEVWRATETLLVPARKPCKSQVVVWGVEVPRRLKEALVAWDHRTISPVLLRAPTQASGFIRTFELAGSEKFLCDHVVDGQILVPVCHFSMQCCVDIRNHSSRNFSHVP